MYVCMLASELYILYQSYTAKRCLICFHRLAKICLDLKMYQAASFHEKAVGDIFINEKEQGRYVTNGIIK